jgi:hypothetical protein
VTRARVAAAGVGVLAALVAAAATTSVLPVAPSVGSNGVVEIPCRPVLSPGGIAECTWTGDIPDGARVVILGPAPGPSARMVRDQVRDAREGTP